MKIYEIGFQCDNYWFPIELALSLKKARELVKEIGKEYEARPQIKIIEEK